MKREIKFRAWDKKLKCWYTPIHEAYKGKLHELLIGFRGDLLAHKLTGLEHESLWPDKFELMQFTGLKDKNGEDIYEGDIVRHDDPNWGYGGKYDKKNDGYISHEITFEDGCFCLKDGLELYNFKDCEVIGNIYENPELL